MAFSYGKVLRTDYASFVARCFHTVNPGVEFEANWHIDLIAHYLEAARAGQIRRLIINMPPRHLKSLCVSVAWPAWLLGHAPDCRIMAASYAANLSIKHSLDCRAVMQSGWYRTLFPATVLAPDQNEKHKFMTTQRGFRFATSVGGAATGEGGQMLIIDDPLNPMQAATHYGRKLANEWFDATFSTRLDDARIGAIVLVMQRLHEDDLSGHLLARGGWELLRLPAIALEEEWHEPVKYRRAAGEPLHGARQDANALEQIKREQGTAAFAAQYQQQPLPQMGKMIQRGWFPRYLDLPTKDAKTQIVQSWDTGFKAGAHNDPSVGLTFALHGGRSYLVDVARGRWEYPQLRERVLEAATRHTPHMILLEEMASGQSLLQDLRANFPLPLRPTRPRGDKEARLRAVLGMIEAGTVFLPEHAPWLEEFEAELLAFPNGRHDDQVDALTQFLEWLRTKSLDYLNIRRI